MQEYQFEAEQQAFGYFDQQPQQPQYAPPQPVQAQCPKCGNWLNPVVCKKGEHCGENFYSCNTKPEYGQVCPGGGFFAWENQLNPDGSWKTPPPRPQQAKRPAPSGGFSGHGQPSSRPAYSASGYSPSARQPPPQQAYRPQPAPMPPAPSAASSLTLPPQPQTAGAGPHPVTKVLKDVADHICSLESLVQEQTDHIHRLEYKVDCLVALLRGKKDEEDGSEAGLPRPASSTS